MVEKNSGLPILPTPSPPTPPSDPLPAKNKALTTNNANALRILEAKCVSLSLFPLPSPALTDHRLACARADNELDEMEKLQKDIEKINREVNLSKELYSKNYGNLSDLNKRNKSLNVQLDMQVLSSPQPSSPDSRNAGSRASPHPGAGADCQRRGEEPRRSIRPVRPLPSSVLTPRRRETRPQILWVTGKKKNKADAETDNATAGKELAVLPDAPLEEGGSSTDLEINPEQVPLVSALISSHGSDWKEDLSSLRLRSLRRLLDQSQR
jgi:hypothetical protein